MVRAHWALAFFLGIASLQASPTFDYSLSGTDGNGSPVSALLVFTVTDAHHFTISATDTTNMQELEQILQGISFDLNGNSVLLLSSSGDIVEVGPDGSVTDLGSASTGWGLEQSNGGWKVCATCGSGGHGIVGAGPYSGTLAGTYLDGTVTFDFYTASTLALDGTNPFNDVVGGLPGGETVTPSGPGGTPNQQNGGLTPGNQDPGPTLDTGDPNDPSNPGDPNNLNDPPNNDPGSTPNQPTNSQTAVPEPGTPAAILAGLALFAATRLRRRA